MFINVFPNFQKGRILKAEMLESLRDFPRNFWDIYLHGYSDGIIAGADVIVGDNHVTITKGIVKYQEQFYMLEHEVQVPFFNTNKEVFIKVKFGEEVAKSDFRIRSANILIEDLPLQKDELELGRFKLREGAQLRFDYTDFFDFITEYNTINIVHVQYAGLGKNTISPMLLRYFSKIVMKSGSQNVYDICFVMHCLNQELVDRETILYYLTNRLGISDKDYSNLEIYQYLRTIVKEVKSGMKRNVENNVKKPAKIIVD